MLVPVVLSVFVFEIGFGLLIVDPRQENQLINLATIYYMNPDPGSKSPVLKLSDVKNILNKKSVKLVIHGYIATIEHAAVTPLRNAYLSKGRDTLLMAEWKEASLVFYTRSRYFVERLGIRFARILKEFLRKQNIDPMNVHILGHSLGAHIAYVMGRSFNGTIGRVTGLDPARPLFEGNCSDCLNANAAKFVDVVHTGFPLFGDITPRGHADFYPHNGYAVQPGCELKDIISATSCSHYRAPLLFAESVRFPKSFPAVACTLNQIVNLRGHECWNGNGGVVGMGESTPPSSRGIYFLDTNNKPPYGRRAFSKVIARKNNSL